MKRFASSLACLLSFTESNAFDATACASACGEDGIPLDSTVSLLQSKTEMTETYDHPIWIDECRSIFIDAGSNIGVQVRKLYEPEKFPGAEFLPAFASVFGEPEQRRRPANESGLCALGFEPNPDHQEKLQAISDAYNAKGWHVHFYQYAVWKEEGKMTFQVDGDPEHSDWAAKLRTDESETAEGKTLVDVRTVDFADFLGSLQAGSVKLMKMDIEGAEYETTARLLEKGSLCRHTIDMAAIEAHPWGPDPNDTARLWKGSLGPDSLWSAINASDCGDSFPTQMLDLDDETYLYSIDDAIGEPPFAPNETAIAVYRNDPEKKKLLPESEGGEYEHWKESLHPEW